MEAEVFSVRSILEARSGKAEDASTDRLLAWLERTSTAFALTLTYALLLWYLRPSLLLSPTITAGGDTIYHYVAAKYLRDYLLPNGKIVGWMPGNLAGFPLFLFYFPLTFLLIAGLSFLVPFPVAFKLGTVAGTFALPLAALLSLRWIGCRFPVPAIGAILTLPFLLMTGNSMWGGNLPSTLAGEFSHSLSFALVVLFQGVLYSGVRTRRRAGWCAVLFAVVGFAHGYGMIIAAGLALYFLAVEVNFLGTFLYLFRVYAIGGLLLGFWLVPLVAYLHYTTGFPLTWDFGSYMEIVPVVLWPTLAVAVITVAMAWWSKQADKEWLRAVHYLTYPVVLSVTLYFVSPRLNLVDVRFLAFAQFFLAPLAAVGLGRLLQARQSQLLRLLAAPLIGVLAIAWIAPQVSFIPNWIRWNYEGMERKPWWRYYAIVNSIALTGGPHSPRVVYEHSVLHDKAGTLRAFEALPLFSGRPTLEGAYMQSSPSSPFIFYIQSELTETPSCPFLPYR
ncbi:MAG: 6-pyruvoyl-tetrahydropterin synthase-related protein, partial [Candidatus Methylomirabilis sp.]